MIIFLLFLLVQLMMIQAFLIFPAHYFLVTTIPFILVWLYKEIEYLKADI
jgi:hypothetical protein